jgi:putative tryptophan/tyrosine transport system substrate-binding protein
MKNHIFHSVIICLVTFFCINSTTLLGATKKKAGTKKAVASKIEKKALKKLSVIDWFKFKPELSTFWELVPDKRDHFRFSIVPKNIPKDRDVKNVIALFPKKSSAYDTAMAKILSVFAQKNILARFLVINFKMDDKLGLNALNLAEKKNYDMIFSMGSSSTSFVYKNFSGKSVPVVSVCSKDPVLMGQMDDYEKGSNTNLALTSLNMPVSIQMAYLKKLKKDLKVIAVLFAKQNKSAVITQVEPLHRIAKDLGITVIDVEVENRKKAEQELRKKVPEAVNKIKALDPNMQSSIFWITGSTSVFREIRTINKYADKIPVLCVVPDVVKEGDDSALLSIGVSFSSNAHLAAIYGIDILSGKVKAGDLKVGIVSPPDIAINFKKSKAIDLKIPFSFFESANFIYDYDGIIVRSQGRKVIKK